MKWNKYNVFFEREEGCFLYNTLSNSFAQLDKSTYLSLLSDFNNPDTGNLLEDEDLTENLRKMKAIDADVDLEFLRLRHLDNARKFNRTRLGLTINPTLACNFRCPYCFEKDHPRKFMTDEVEDEIVRFAENNTYSKAIDVTWFGGEPLLAFDRVRSLTKRLMNLGKDYAAGMITNGYLLNSNIAKELESLKINGLQITIDGDRETHDSRRHLENGGPTFNRILENICTCQEIAPKVHVSIRVNIDPTNQNKFLDIYRHIKSLNLPNAEIYPGFVSEKESGKTSDCTLCGRQESVNFLLSLYKNHGLKYFKSYPSSGLSKCTAECIGGTVVGPEGELYKCWEDVGNPNKVYGNLKEGITNRKIILRYLEAASKFDDPSCVECVLFPICSGGCPHTRIRKRYEIPDLDTCPIYKDNLEDFLYLHYIYKAKGLKHDS